jgi:hypothetical protein
MDRLPCWDARVCDMKVEWPSGTQQKMGDLSVASTQGMVFPVFLDGRFHWQGRHHHQRLSAAESLLLVWVGLHQQERQSWAADERR